MAWARRRRAAEALVDRVAADPAVAIPQRVAFAEAHAMHHAVAEKPVVGGGIFDMHRIGANAGVQAIQFGRYFAGNAQPGFRSFACYGGEGALKERVPVAVGHTLARLARNPAGGLFDQVGRDCLHLRHGVFSRGFMLTMPTWRLMLALSTWGSPLSGLVAPWGTIAERGRDVE